jgi:hypothetical protein
VTELARKKTSLVSRVSPMRKLRLSVNSLDDVEEPQSFRARHNSHAFIPNKPIVKPRRKNINDIITDYIEKINDNYFDNFVEEQLMQSCKLEKDSYDKMKRLYNDYWDDKYQFDMMLNEIGDDSILLFI